MALNSELMQKNGLMATLLAREFITKKIDDRIKVLSEELNVGVPTLTDIIGELKKPGRDPREEMPKVVFRSDVKSFEDMKVGMNLTGTVRNVVDFGAFVDIGVKQDGLVHLSEMSDKYIKNPMDVVQVGDTVNVTIISIDKERQRIGLSMKKSLRSKNDWYSYIPFWRNLS